MSWREKLRGAHRAVAKAEEERARVFREAQEAGISLRGIEDATGVSSSTISRWIGPAPKVERSLDQEAL